MIVSNGTVHCGHDRLKEYTFFVSFYMMMYSLYLTGSEINSTGSGQKSDKFQKFFLMRDQILNKIIHAETIL